MGNFAKLPTGTELTVGSHAVTIVEYLSEGGFAHIYKVKIDPIQNDSDIACLKRVIVPDKNGLNQLRKEVDVMKILKDSRNIVKYYDSHAERLEDGTYQVLVLMELCPNKSLLDYMNSKIKTKLTEPEILNIMYDISLGIYEMHSLKMVHRDIKIENVLIDSKHSFKLADFGSTSSPIPPPKDHHQFQVLSHDILYQTTPQYRSPEMIDLYRGFPIDEKSDIWALGCFLYKLCYYTTPFEANGDIAILHASFQFLPAPSFSGDLKNLIIIMLQENPVFRPNIFQVLMLVAKLMKIEFKEIKVHDFYKYGPYNFHALHEYQRKKQEDMLKQQQMYYQNSQANTPQPQTAFALKTQTANQNQKLQTPVPDTVTQLPQNPIARQEPKDQVRQQVSQFAPPSTVAHGDSIKSTLLAHPSSGSNEKRKSQLYEDHVPSITDMFDAHSDNGVVRVDTNDDVSFGELENLDDIEERYPSLEDILDTSTKSTKSGHSAHSIPSEPSAHSPVLVQAQILPQLNVVPAQARAPAPIQASVPPVSNSAPVPIPNAVQQQQKILNPVLGTQIPNNTVHQQHQQQLLTPALGPQLSKIYPSAPIKPVVLNATDVRKLTKEQLKHYNYQHQIYQYQLGKYQYQIQQQQLHEKQRKYEAHLQNIPHVYSSSHESTEYEKKETWKKLHAKIDNSAKKLVDDIFAESPQPQKTTQSAKSDRSQKGADANGVVENTEASKNTDYKPYELDDLIDFDHLDLEKSDIISRSSEVVKEVPVLAVEAQQKEIVKPNRPVNAQGFEEYASSSVVPTSGLEGKPGQTVAPLQSNCVGSNPFPFQPNPIQDGTSKEAKNEFRKSANPWGEYRRTASSTTIPISKVASQTSNYGSDHTGAPAHNNELPLPNPDFLNPHEGLQLSTSRSSRDESEEPNLIDLEIGLDSSSSSGATPVLRPKTNSGKEIYSLGSDMSLLDLDVKEDKKPGEQKAAFKKRIPSTQNPSQFSFQEEVIDFASDDENPENGSRMNRLSIRHSLKKPKSRKSSSDIKRGENSASEPKKRISFFGGGGKD